MSKTTIRQKSCKYRLYDLLFKKYGTDYIEGKKALAKEFGMSLSTINTDFGIPAKGKRSIPKPRRILYAQHFGVSEAELMHLPKKRIVKAA